MGDQWSESTDGPALRQARVERKLKQAEAAELLGVKQTTVSSWETGASVPRPDQISVIRREFGVGSETPPQTNSAADWKSSVDAPALREARIKRKLTQGQAASLLGVKQATVSSWETGAAAPRAHQVEVIRREFGDASATPDVALRPNAIVRTVGADKPVPSVHQEGGSWDRAVRGPSLRSARLQAALTQADVAKALHVAQPTIANWEGGKSSPKADQIMALEDLLGSLAGRDEAEEEASAPLGAWVNRNRSERKWTVPQLAKRANVTPAAIYRIENGKTANIQQKTLERLERAFGTKLEQETKKEISREATVEGIGELEDFDPHDDENLPMGPGIYVLYDISERPIYVGMSGNIRNRLRDHSQKFWFKRPIVQSASYVVIADERRRREIETLLIKFLKSNAVLNKSNTDR